MGVFDCFCSRRDSGDIVGCSGTVKRTEKGELSVYVDSWEMLTKSLAPLPDKFKGLADISVRYRRRELDMIANPSVRRTFELRRDSAQTGSRLRIFSWFLRVCRRLSGRGSRVI